MMTAHFLGSHTSSSWGSICIRTSHFLLAAGITSPNIIPEQVTSTCLQQATPARCRPSLVMCINDISIHHVEQFKLLDIKIDSNLNWIQLINNIRLKLISYSTTHLKIWSENWEIHVKRLNRVAIALDGGCLFCYTLSNSLPYLVTFVCWRFRKLLNPACCYSCSITDVCLNTRGIPFLGWDVVLNIYIQWFRKFC